MEAKGPCFKEICPCGLNKEIKGHACILLSKDLGKNGVQGLGDETVRQTEAERGRNQSEGCLKSLSYSCN